ncbi:methyltransferase family protein [Maribacter sp. MAR_2009_72]|nr:methyltransferase family protein [Maribacter sp. MAR_2009_72]
MKGNTSKKVKRPWPTKAAMEQVYAMQLWGENGTAFYSGEGSHLPNIVTPYIEVVSSFLGSFERPLRVCDLGCGDFNIGSTLVAYTVHYIAIDIVESLIVHNQKTFLQENLEFHCLDIAVDPLPKADCAVVRQVLQHLSNQEIQQIVEKLAQYRYVLLTEHLPDQEFEPNKDIISGQGIRLKNHSGVDLLAPPFNFKVKKETQLLSLPVAKGKIVTKLYQVF